MKGVKTAFQDPDTRLFQVDGKMVTEEELDALMNLFPSIKWITIHFQGPPFERKTNNDKQTDHE